MDTQTLLKIYAGCARREICRHFPGNSCIASTAITMDVMSHYGRASLPWEVCVHVTDSKHNIELGCHPPASEQQVGGHLVAVVQGSFLVDASLSQVTKAYPELEVPSVLVGELLPTGQPLQNSYRFRTPRAEVVYAAHRMSRDFRESSDWGPSPQRDEAASRIIDLIDQHGGQHGIE